MGQFALFTYLRPFLETVPHVGVSTLSVMLTMIEVAGFIGTTIVGRFLKNGLNRSPIAIPILMGVVAMALILFGGGITVTTVLLGLWGLLGAASPVAWDLSCADIAERCRSRRPAHDGCPELTVASSAIVGGLLFDAKGYQAIFATSAVLLLIAGLLVLLTSRSAQPAEQVA